MQKQFSLIALIALISIGEVTVQGVVLPEDVQRALLEGRTIQFNPLNNKYSIRESPPKPMSFMEISQVAAPAAAIARTISLVLDSNQVVTTPKALICGTIAGLLWLYGSFNAPDVHATKDGCKALALFGGYYASTTAVVDVVNKRFGGQKQPPVPGTHE